MLRRARALLAAAAGHQARRPQSGLYVTAPVGGPEQDDYLNQVVELRTTLSPRELLAGGCSASSRSWAASALVRWGPRSIDVDILWYHGFSSADADLEVPHPRMEERRFVLEPLAELAPDLVLPEREDGGGGPRPCARPGGERAVDARGGYGAASRSESEVGSYGPLDRFTAGDPPAGPREGRRHPGPQLPAARGAGRGRHRGRLAGSLPPGGGFRRPHDRVLRRALHGRDRGHPGAGPAGHPTRDPRRLPHGRHGGRGRACRHSRPSTRAQWW